MVVLGVDPGSKRIGIAVSDPTGSFARPLIVIEHISRPLDAARIAQVAQDHAAGLIVVGQAFDLRGQPTLEGRRSARLAGALRLQTGLPVVLWDESYTTRTAQETRAELGVARSKRQGHMDEVAASFILQSYLDAHHTTG